MEVKLYYMTMDGPTVPLKYTVDPDDLSKFVEDVSDAYKYFKGYFTDPEIKWIEKYKNKILLKIQDIKNPKNKVRDKKRKIASLEKEIKNLEDNILNQKGKVQRQILNGDTYTTEYEGIEKIGPNKYKILWGT